MTTRNEIIARRDRSAQLLGRAMREQAAELVAMANVIHDEVPDAMAVVATANRTAVNLVSYAAAYAVAAETGADTGGERQ